VLLQFVSSLSACFVFINSSAESRASKEFYQDSIADQLYVADIEMPANLSAVRMVALRKSPGEPLGLTVKSEDGQLVVARILGGGAVDRQGLLHVGDIIGEVNGVVVRSAEQLQVEIARCKENIQLKVLPSFHEIGSNGVQVGDSGSTIQVYEAMDNSVCKRDE